MTLIVRIAQVVGLGATATGFKLARSKDAPAHELAKKFFEAAKECGIFQPEWAPFHIDAPSNVFYRVRTAEEVASGANISPLRVVDRTGKFEFEDLRENCGPALKRRGVGKLAAADVERARWSNQYEPEEIDAATETLRAIGGFFQEYVKEALKAKADPLRLSCSDFSDVADAAEIQMKLGAEGVISRSNAKLLGQGNFGMSFGLSELGRKYAVKTVTGGRFLPIGTRNGKVKEAHDEWKQAKRVMSISSLRPYYVQYHAWCTITADGGSKVMPVILMSWEKDAKACAWRDHSDSARATPGTSPIERDHQNMKWETESQKEDFRKWQTEMAVNLLADMDHGPEAPAHDGNMWCPDMTNQEVATRRSGKPSIILFDLGIQEDVGAAIAKPLEDLPQRDRARAVIKETMSAGELKDALRRRMTGLLKGMNIRSLWNFIYETSSKEQGQGKKSDSLRSRLHNQWGAGTRQRIAVDIMLKYSSSSPGRM